MFSVCVCVVFFCVCEQLEALRRADHPSKESYLLSLIKKLRKLSPMLQSRSKLPRVGATRKKKKRMLYITSMQHVCHLVGHVLTQYVCFLHQRMNTGNREFWKQVLIYVRFEVSTAVTMMIIIFWEMTPRGSYKNRRFGGSYRLHLQGARVRAGYRAKL
jgi:hypothetical protein